MIEDTMTIKQFLEIQMEWSKKTFGAGPRTLGIIEHIKKELIEVQNGPWEEWIDVVILALDGAWRSFYATRLGGDESLPGRVAEALIIKQRINLERQYPHPVSQDVTVEHIKDDPRIGLTADGHVPYLIPSKGKKES
jgi:hypothetical protein